MKIHKNQKGMVNGQELMKASQNGYSYYMFNENA